MFRLVSCVSSLEKYRNQEVSGIARSDGGIDWRRLRYFVSAQLCVAEVL